MRIARAAAAAVVVVVVVNNAVRSIIYAVFCTAVVVRLTQVFAVPSASAVDSNLLIGNRRTIRN